MRLNDKNIALANELRAIVSDRTEVVSDGEGVAMILLWGFLIDHAEAMNLDLEELAREQLEAFIEHARDNLKMMRPS